MKKFWITFLTSDFAITALHEALMRYGPQTSEWVNEKYFFDLFKLSKNTSLVCLSRKQVSQWLGLPDVLTKDNSGKQKPTKKDVQVVDATKSDLQH